MNVKELIATLSRTKWELETELEENGGVLTDELLAKADNLEEMKSLLAGEGIDELGRWLKSVQDELAARRVKNLKGYEDYVKHLIGEALDATGQESAKGTFYGFKRTTSNTTSVNWEKLNEDWLATAMAAAREVMPSYIDVELKTNTATLKHFAGFGSEEYLIEESSPAIRFTKPRASKE